MAEGGSHVPESLRHLIDKEKAKKAQEAEPGYQHRFIEETTGIKIEPEEVSVEAPAEEVALDEIVEPVAEVREDVEDPASTAAYEEPGSAPFPETPREAVSAGPPPPDEPRAAEPAPSDEAEDRDPYVQELERVATQTRENLYQDFEGEPTDQDKRARLLATLSGHETVITHYNNPDAAQKSCVVLLSLLSEGIVPMTPVELETMRKLLMEQKVPPILLDDISGMMSTVVREKLKDGSFDAEGFVREQLAEMYEKNSGNLDRPALKYLIDATRSHIDSKLAYPISLGGPGEGGSGAAVVEPTPPVEAIPTTETLTPEPTPTREAVETRESEGPNEFGIFTERADVQDVFERNINRFLPQKAPGSMITQDDRDRAREMARVDLGDRLGREVYIRESNGRERVFFEFDARDEKQCKTFKDYAQESLVVKFVAANRKGDISDEELHIMRTFDTRSISLDGEEQFLIDYFLNERDDYQSAPVQDARGNPIHEPKDRFAAMTDSERDEVYHRYRKNLASLVITLNAYAEADNDNSSNSPKSLDVQIADALHTRIVDLRNLSGKLSKGDVEMLTAEVKKKAKTAAESRAVEPGRTDWIPSRGSLQDAFMKELEENLNSVENAMRVSNRGYSDAHNPSVDIQTLADNAEAIKSIDVARLFRDNAGLNDAMQGYAIGLQMECADTHRVVQSDFGMRGGKSGKEKAEEYAIAMLTAQAIEEKGEPLSDRETTQISYNVRLASGLHKTVTGEYWNILANVLDGDILVQRDAQGRPEIKRENPSSAVVKKLLQIVAGDEERFGMSTIGVHGIPSPRYFGDIDAVIASSEPPRGRRDRNGWRPGIGKSLDKLVKSDYESLVKLIERSKLRPDPVVTTLRQECFLLRDLYSVKQAGDQAMMGKEKVPMLQADIDLAEARARESLGITPDAKPEDIPIGYYEEVIRLLREGGIASDGQTDKDVYWGARGAIAFIEDNLGSMMKADTSDAPRYLQGIENPAGQEIRDRKKQLESEAEFRRTHGALSSSRTKARRFIGNFFMLHEGELLRKDARPKSVPRLIMEGLWKSPRRVLGRLISGAEAGVSSDRVGGGLMLSERDRKYKDIAREKYLASFVYEPLLKNNPALALVLQNPSVEAQVPDEATVKDLVLAELRKTQALSQEHEEALYRVHEILLQNRYRNTRKGPASGQQSPSPEVVKAISDMLLSKDVSDAEMSRLRLPDVATIIAQHEQLVSQMPGWIADQNLAAKFAKNHAIGLGSYNAQMTGVGLDYSKIMTHALDIGTLSGLKARIKVKELHTKLFGEDGTLSNLKIVDEKSAAEAGDAVSDIIREMSSELTKNPAEKKRIMGHLIVIATSSVIDESNEATIFDSNPAKFFLTSMNRSHLRYIMLATMVNKLGIDVDEFKSSGGIDVDEDYNIRRHRNVRGYNLNPVTGKAILASLGDSWEIRRGADKLVAISNEWAATRPKKS